MDRCWITITVLAVAWVGCLPCYAEPPKNDFRVIHAASESWLDATRSSGTGLFWSILREAVKPYGIELDPAIYSYKVTTRLLEQKKVDVLVGAYPDELPYGLFCPYPFIEDVVEGVTLKDSNFNWNEETMVRASKHGWIRGYAYNKYLPACQKYVEFPNRKTVIGALMNGRIQSYIDSNTNIDDSIQYGLIDENTIVRTELASLGLYFVFAENERGRFFLEKYEEGFRRLCRSGELKRLFEEQGNSRFKYPSITP